MPTRLVFAAARGESPLVVRVDGTPIEVLDQWIEAGGQPFIMEKENGERVYINPTAVAYWEEAPERRSPTPMTTEKEALPLAD